MSQSIRQCKIARCNLLAFRGDEQRAEGDREDHEHATHPSAFTAERPAVLPTSTGIGCAQDEPVTRLLYALAALPILLGGCGDGGPATPLAYGNGVHVVGTEIEPGTYYSPGVTSDALNCTGTVTHAEGSNPVAHSSSVDHTSSRAQTVTITPTDQTFESEGCLPWTKVEVRR